MSDDEDYIDVEDQYDADDEEYVDGNDEDEDDDFHRPRARRRSRQRSASATKVKRTKNDEEDDGEPQPMVMDDEEEENDNVPVNIEVVDEALLDGGQSASAQPTEKVSQSANGVHTFKLFAFTCRNSKSRQFRQPGAGATQRR